MEKQLQALKEERTRVESATPAEYRFELAQAEMRAVQAHIEAMASSALMLFPHSGRNGFDNIQPDPAVPTPPKEVVCAMLKRETELRNAPETQALLDGLRRPRVGRAEEQRGEPATLEEAKELIAALRSQLRSERCERPRGAG